jgi:hypothetical protein
VGHFQDIKDATVEAQTEFAEMKGMTPGGTNVLYRGVKYVGTWGDQQVTEVMNPAGGWRRRHQIILMVTCDQFSTAPDSKEQIIRTDLSPPITYRIDVLPPSDGFHYVFHCIKVGE